MYVLFILSLRINEIIRWWWLFFVSSTKIASYRLVLSYHRASSAISLREIDRRARFYDRRDLPRNCHPLSESLSPISLPGSPSNEKNARKGLTRERGRLRGGRGRGRKKKTRRRSRRDRAERYHRYLDIIIRDSHFNRAIARATYACFNGLYGGGAAGRRSKERRPPSERRGGRTRIVSRAIVAKVKSITVVGQLDRAACR